jgi:hypothetical protein
VTLADSNFVSATLVAVTATIWPHVTFAAAVAQTPDIAASL